MSDAGRFIKVQEQIEARLTALMKGMAAAGYSPQEIGAAVIDIADNWVLSRACNDQTERDIRVAIETARRKP